MIEEALISRLTRATANCLLYLPTLGSTPYCSGFWWPVRPSYCKTSAQASSGCTQATSGGAQACSESVQAAHPHLRLKQQQQQRLRSRG